MVIHHDVVDGKDLFHLINIFILYLEIVVVLEVVDQVLVEVIRIVVHVLDHIHVLDRTVHLDQKNDEHDQDLVIVDEYIFEVKKNLYSFLFLNRISSI